ncbi:MAG: DNA helicase UvrD [Candidatus Omnitrophica bacterium]|nr:DNA helicase UvrD [Candidatus Omnitrophota bacterium]
MPELVADFHLHSRYSRACSKDLSVAELAKWAKLKGITVLGTGDFTHPLWWQELSETLRDTGRGLYEFQGVHFMVTTEVNTLFYKGGRAHQIHHLIFLPSLEAAQRLNAELANFGDLSLDGRPMLKMEAWRLVEIVLGIEPRAMVIPAHAWTPHFSIFGSNSGFDSVAECFEQQARHIHALETGLSSDPAMNWRLSALDRYALISNSDAHSARRLGREANVFDCELSYEAITGAIKAKDPARFRSTIEFFPEEGKYHLDGHRFCKVRTTPAETKAKQYRCPVCGRKLTVGVMHRVDDLADRPEGSVPARALPFKRTVPLEEILADVLGVGVGTQAVEREYHQLVYKCGSELRVLLAVPESELRAATSPRIADAVLRMRQGRVRVEPGYDGEYGVVKILADDAPAAAQEEQLTLF